MCDMTYSNVSHDPFIVCVCMAGAHVLLVCDVTHVCVCDVIGLCVRRDSFVCMTRPLCMCVASHSYVSHDPFIVCVCMACAHVLLLCVIGPMCVCDVINLCVWRDSFVCMTYPFVCVSRLIHMCDVTPSPCVSAWCVLMSYWCVRRDPCVRVT